MSIGDILSSGIMFVSEQTIHPQYHHEEVYVRCASLFDTTVHYVVWLEYTQMILYSMTIPLNNFIT